MSELEKLPPTFGAMDCKLRVGDLVTHDSDDDWLGIILEIKDRSIESDLHPDFHIPCWYCKVRFPSGFEQWHNDSRLNLQASSKNGKL